MALALVTYVALVKPAVQPRRLSILPPEGTRLSGSLALSLDGRMLVFGASKADGSSALYIRPLDAVDAKMLNGTDGGSDPFGRPTVNPSDFLRNRDSNVPAPFKVLHRRSLPRWTLVVGRGVRITRLSSPQTVATVCTAYKQRAARPSR